MKTDKTSADLDTPAFRRQRITGLRRELDEALDLLSAVATALNGAGVPFEANGTQLDLPSRVRWLIFNKKP